MTSRRPLRLRSFEKSWTSDFPTFDVENVLSRGKLINPTMEEAGVEPPTPLIGMLAVAARGVAALSPGVM